MSLSDALGDNSTDVIEMDVDNKHSLQQGIKFNELKLFLNDFPNVISNLIMSNSGKVTLKIETCTESKFIDYSYNTFFRYSTCFVEEHQGNDFKFIAYQVTPLGQVISVSNFNSPAELGDIIKQMKQYYLCTGKSDEFLLKNVHNLQISDLFLMQVEQYGDNQNLSFRSRDCKYFVLKDESDTKLKDFNGEILCDLCHDFFMKMNEDHVEEKKHNINDYLISPLNEEDTFQITDDSHYDDDLKDNDYSDQDIPSSPSSGSWKPGGQGDDDDLDNFNDQFVGENGSHDKSSREKKKTKVKKKRGPKPKKESEREKNIQCVECNMKFRFETNYNKHLLLSHKKKLSSDGCLVPIDNSTIVCPLCPDLTVEFQTQDELENHRIKKHYDTQIKIEVEKQQETCKTKFVKKYTCTKCDKSYVNLSMFAHHQQVVHGINVGKIGKAVKTIDKKCYFCPKRFCKLGPLGRHLVKYHSDKDLSEIPEVQLHNPKASEICDICGKSFFNLPQHKQLSHSDNYQVSCTVCERKIKKSYLKIHMKTHEKRDYLCNICGSKFVNASHLLRHSRIHDVDYKHLPCEYCGKKFGRQGELNTHVKTTHLNQRDHKCEVCGKDFTSRFRLKRHLIVHGADKQFNCEVCSYSSTRLDNLNTHRTKTHGLTRITKKKIWRRKRMTMRMMRIGKKISTIS